MDKQNEKESEARKLLDKIKLNHEKSKMSRLMDRNNTSRRLVYRNRVDMQNKERGARVAQIYADKVQVSFLTFKGRILRVRILAHIFMEHNLWSINYDSWSDGFFQADKDMRKEEARKMKHAQYGAIKKHHETFANIMTEVAPEYTTRNINFEKRSNKIQVELPPIDS